MAGDKLKAMRQAAAKARREQIIKVIPDVADTALPDIPYICQQCGGNIYQREEHRCTLEKTNTVRADLEEAIKEKIRISKENPPAATPEPAKGTLVIPKGGSSTAPPKPPHKQGVGHKGRYPTGTVIAATYRGDAVHGQWEAVLTVPGMKPIYCKRSGIHHLLATLYTMYVKAVQP